MTCLTQLAFHGQQLQGFLLLHALERDAGELADDVHDVVFRDEHFLFLTLFAPIG